MSERRNSPYVQDVLFSSICVDSNEHRTSFTNAAKPYLVDAKSHGVSAGAKVKPAEEDEDALVRPGRFRFS